MDPRNPHNAYRYQQPGQAAPLYIPPSSGTRRIQPVPQTPGQGDYHYGMPGQASPVYVPPSAGAGQRSVRPMPRPTTAEASPGKDKNDDSRRLLASKMGEKFAGGSGGMAGGSGASGGGGMMAMMSDERSKKEIARLEGANEALTSALSASPAASYPDTNAPSSGMQALGQQNGLPSSASFPDSPAADKVAAQNVGLQQGQPMPMQPNPSQSNMGRSASPAFNVGAQPPDLAALDEAYKRMGQGG